MDVQRLAVKWRERLIEIPVCLSVAEVDETEARWKEGVIDLPQIFEIESPSSPDARALIVRLTLKAAGESIPATRHQLGAGMWSGVPSSAIVRGYLEHLVLNGKPFTPEEAAQALAAVIASARAPRR